MNPTRKGGVLLYKWEAYCSTNGRCIVGFPFLQGLAARKALRYKWGGVLPYKVRCAAVLSPRPVGVGVSETLLIVIVIRATQANSCFSDSSEHRCPREVE